MSVADEIDEAFAAEETLQLDAEEGKNNTSKDGGEEEGEEEGEEKPEGEEEKKEPEDGDKKPKKVNGVQKRIDTLTREKYELQRQLDEALKKNQPSKRQMPEKPDPRAFRTEREYRDAVVRYETKVEHINELIKEDGEREFAAKQERLRDKIRTEAVKFPDFAETVRNVNDIELDTDVMFDFVINDPNGVEALYWLGKHRDTAEKISRMSAAEQARTLGKLLSNIAASKKGKQVSGAPKPPSKVGGKGATAAKSLKDMTGDEYIAWRKSQESKSKK